MQIVSGAGFTNGVNNDWASGTVNGLGNLIVGYNEIRVDDVGNPTNDDDRSGSHNIIVGKWNNYSSSGGLVAGYQNTISGIYSSVSGGSRNTADGHLSSVSGGYERTATGTYNWRAGALLQNE
ncbi:MAG: hypothetical protein GY754_41585 [bacterium]|nr:hypothetical protein [bacterium]